MNYNNINLMYCTFTFTAHNIAGKPISNEEMLNAQIHVTTTTVSIL